MADMVYYNAHRAMAVGELNVAKHSLKCMFLTYLYEPNQDHATVDDVSAKEIQTKNGYRPGGVPVKNYQVTADSETKTTIHTCDDISIDAKGGPIGPVRYAVIYGNGKLLYMFDFGTEKVADDGTPFKIIMDPNGLFTVA